MGGTAVNPKCIECGAYAGWSFGLYHLCTIHAVERLEPELREQSAYRRGLEDGAKTERERLAQLIERPLAWLCLDHGGEEAEKIAQWLREGGNDG